MRYFKFILTLALGLILFVGSVSAQDSKQAVIVNPIRGSDFWAYAHSIVDTPQKQYGIISGNSLSATWLVRFDALASPEIINLLHTFDTKQDIGVFFEVTPSLAKAAGVLYNESSNWHDAKAIFLIGYSPSDRQKLIDMAFTKFKETFRYYPKSVGAWWIDAYSLSYMREKYDIEANLDVADQHSTDQYQVWGQYFSTPFYPSKLNALIPAQSPEQKIGVVTVQWATRDPYNGYGNGDFDSTYSIQANDYFLHKLDSKYFEKILDIYPEVTVGLENDFDWKTFGEEYQKQIQILAYRQRAGTLNVLSMKDYASYYQKTYPEISPKVLISADDPLGSGGKVVWYQTPRSRIGWFYDKKNGSAIRDLRLYDAGSEENCFRVACNKLSLVVGGLSAIDDAISGTKWLIDEGEIKDFEVDETGGNLVISYLNQSGNSRIIKLLDNDIIVGDKVQTISGAILNVKQAALSASPQNSDPSKITLNISWLKLAENAFKFIFGTVIFFLLPGWLLTRRLIFAIPVGWALFTLASFLTGFLHADLALWLIPIGSLLVMIKIGRPKIHCPQINLEAIFLTLLIIIGSLTWFVTMAKSGLIYNFGLGFWGPNGHDAIWHLALISELQRNFPPQNPVFAGENLSNYHYFFDLLIAKMGSLLAIDSQDLLFRFFPLMFSAIGGILIFVTTRKVFNDFRAGLFATFFFYFGGSFGWVVSYLRDHSFGGESMFWMQQSISALLNPPFAISIVFLLAGFLMLWELLNDPRKKIFIIPIILVWGSLIEFKVYGGLLVLAGLGAIALQRLIRDRDFVCIKIFVGCLLVSLIVFLPNNLASSGLLVFSPFWIVNSMIDFVDRLGWQRLSQARQAYLATGNILKLVGTEAVALFIFVVGNFGTRLLIFGAMWQGFKKIKEGNVAVTFLAAIFVIGLAIPLLFIQKGNGWNIVQFSYYSLLVADIFAGAVLAWLLKRLGWKIGGIIISLIFLITIPTTVGSLNNYLPARPPAKLSVQEINALEFLKGQPQGTVLTFPYDQSLKNNFTEPVPLLAYTSTAYVAAYSNHPTFLEDTINLEILGVSYKGRLNDVRDLIKSKEQTKSILLKNNIKYLYIAKAYDFREDEGQMGIKKIFENDEVKIFKVI